MNDTERIDYKKTVNSSKSYQKGISLRYFDHDWRGPVEPRIQFQVINQKLGTITTGIFMEIPMENIDELIHALQNLKR